MESCSVGFGIGRIRRRSAVLLIVFKPLHSLSAHQKLQVDSERLEGENAKLRDMLYERDR
jgi:hypothetical protein